MATTAQIITHERFNRPQVIQTRSKRGRLPKSVTNLWRYGFDKRVAAMEETSQQENINELRGGIAVAERVVASMRYELAGALQQANTGRGQS